MKDFEYNLRRVLGYEAVLTGHHHGLRYWADASDEIKRLLMLQEDFSFQYQHTEDGYRHFRASYSRPYINQLLREVSQNPITMKEKPCA